ncbi:hypothetical protein GCM10022243_53200 [Saccharothrix violaceirubra]|uniref:histidine kinase n=1 Tax=Saccharothrix violaceirubra TaxID=413306 RepID=A0A7W7SYS3_9PSEU|nr:ATP-binding protein [Saccharothrix violaceirubra]MBB4963383.1 signal transduction histidine kinase [Saccharothrix violaceirubra]
MTGAVEAEALRVGRRYLLTGRIVVVACAGLVGIVQAPAATRGAVAAVVAAALLWHVVLTRRPDARWTVPGDTVLLVLLCASQPFTVPVPALDDSTNWVLAIVSFTVVATQWNTGIGTGVAVTAVAVAAYLTGAGLADTGTGVWPGDLQIGLWTFAECGLSRALCVLVRAGARVGDRAAAEAEDARRSAALAAARRADEREHLATLHDTAAATVLGVGLGMVRGDEPWLAARAAADLDVLEGRLYSEDGDTDLVRLLAEVARHAPIAVATTAPAAVHLPAAQAVALARATREAVTNAARHAAVDRVSVVVADADGVVSVEVRDTGSGFDVTAVPEARRGISGSITERMRAVGGRSAVHSGASGTVVRVEWPRA